MIAGWLILSFLVLSVVLFIVVSSVWKNSRYTLKCDETDVTDCSPTQLDFVCNNTSSNLLNICNNACKTLKNPCESSYCRSFYTPCSPCITNWRSPACQEPTVVNAYCANNPLCDEYCTSKTADSEVAYCKNTPFQSSGVTLAGAREAVNWEYITLSIDNQLLAFLLPEKVNVPEKGIFLKRNYVSPLSGEGDMYKWRIIMARSTSPVFSIVSYDFPTHSIDPTGKLAYGIFFSYTLLEKNGKLAIKNINGNYLTSVGLSETESFIKLIDHGPVSPAPLYKVDDSPRIIPLYSSTYYFYQAGYVFRSNQKTPGFLRFDTGKITVNTSGEYYWYTTQLTDGSSLFGLDLTNNECNQVFISNNEVQIERDIWAGGYRIKSPDASVYLTVCELSGVGTDEIGTLFFPVSK